MARVVEPAEDPERYVLCTACDLAVSIASADDEECPRCGLDTLTVVTSRRRDTVEGS
jgi:uncharacterized paraquat-inducible protein A